MQRKFLSLLLCFITVFTTVSVGFTNLPVSAASPSVAVTCDNEAVESVSILQNEKKTLSAYCEYGDECEYKWQVLADMDSGLWVDIQGQTEKTIEASYALVSGVIDDNAEAYIRAGIKMDGEEHYSEPVLIACGEPETYARAAEAKASPMALGADENMSALAEGDEDGQDVFVIINYLDAETKNSIWEHFSSQLKKDDGFVFDQTVLSPTWLGFLPFYCKADPDTDDPKLATTPAAELEIYISEAHDEDVVYNVYYKAANVPYGAKFLYQNIYDDLYTENTDKYQTGEAETGTIIDDAKFKEWGDMEGFSALYHYPEAVAADGSTVFECYYDRNYYLLKFDMDGGYGTEPIYAKYETPFFANDPSKPGYVFAGWDKLNEKGKGDGIADELPETVPAEECSYKALWKKTTTTYTTVYWLENPDKPDEYLFWGYRTDPADSEEIVNINPDPNGAKGIKDPNEIRCSSYNANKSDKQIIVKGDGSSVANVYYTRNVYTLVFYQASAGRGYNDNLCGLEEHTHTADCLICEMTEHTHTARCATDNCKHVCDPRCYGATTMPPVATTDDPGYNVANTNNASKRDGYVYRVRTGNRNNYYYYNYFYLNGILYYLGENSTTGNNNNSNVNQYGIRYRFTNNPNNNNAATPCNTAPAHNCTHVHEEECYSCGQKAHTHTAECYSCGKEEHRHTNACKNGYTGQQVNQPRVLFTIKAKYGQYIGDQWPMPDMAEEYLPQNQHFNTWQHRAEGATTLSSQTSKILNMPEDFCFTGGVKKFQLSSNTTNHKWHIYYLIESFNQTSPANGINRRLYNGTYYDVDTDYNQDIFYNTDIWSAKSIKGVTNTGIEYRNANGLDSDAYFYYKRNVHDLTFTIYADEKKTNSNIAFGADISNTNFEPDYPANLEKYAYTFGGWYTTNECVPGSEFKFEGATMPDDNVMLYAKWAPVTHKVDFFLSEDIMNAYLDGRAETDDGTPAVRYEHKDVPHGNNTGSVDHPKDDGKVVFKGWFYYENGEKKRYTPENHPVIRDMNIFAEWGSNVAQPYVVHYVFLPDKSIDPSTLTEQELRSLEPVADDTRGYAYQGSTKTFTAKSGEPFNQLYPQFNQGVFPTYASTSIVMSPVDNPENPIENEVWFFYVQHVPVPYIVRYLDAATGQKLLDDVVYEENNHGVVTERFKPVEGYVPDAIYKRLVLQYDPSHTYKQETGFTENDPQKNVIVFYYRQSEEQRPYIIHHMFENPNIEQGSTPDKDYYTIFDKSGQPTNKNFFEYTKTDATTDQEYIDVKPISVRGYKPVLDYSRLFNVINGQQRETEIQAEDGTFTIRMSDKGKGEAAEFYIYYNLEEFPYTVRYVEYNNSNNELHAPKNGTAEYGTYVTEQYEDLMADGWSLVGAKTQTKQIKDNDAQNIITFFYTRLQYSVQYIVWDKGGGKVSLGSETKSSEPEDVFEGSVPKADFGYEFEGWYLDPECTKSVEPDWVNEDNRIIPDKTKIEPSPSTNNKYYAKFEPTFGSLTIDRNNDDNEGSGEQIFVYRVTDTKTNEVITVTIKGDGEATIKNLNAGDYIVEQENDWSWRFGDEEQNVTVEKGKNSTVTFDEKAEDPYWLSGNSGLAHNVKDKEAD